MKPFQLREISPFREIDYFQLKQALSAYANPHAKIRQLLATGALVRVKKGLYVLGDAYNDQPISLQVLANLIYGPSAISLDYALFYYGLIPEHVHAVTSITPQRNKHFETPVGHFYYRYLAFKKYVVGLTRVACDEVRHVIMASPEKALIDKIYFDKSLVLTTSHDVKDYLFLDLRLEQDRVSALSLDAFTEIASVYQYGNVSVVLNYLRNKG